MNKPLQLFFVGILICLSSSNTFSQKKNNPFLKTTESGQIKMTEKGASHFASLALSCLQKEYPNKLNQVLKDGNDLKRPTELHPAFYGCFDWHSSVHGHWMLVKLLKDFPNLPEAKMVRKKLGENLTAENIKAEILYFSNASKSWERMYGWSWIMKLAEELYNSKDEDAQIWFKNLQPLTDFIIERYMSFLPIQTYPVRTGVHPNTAFGLSFALDYANTTGHTKLKNLIEQRSRVYYLSDCNCPTEFEPSGEDFLSGCLEEANLMRRVLSPVEFEKWFKNFLPKKKLKTLVSPADVSDRSDPKIVHLDGLNLSRAWCMYGISRSIRSKKKRDMMYDAAEKHLRATVPNVVSEHYEWSHWLASFAVFALSSNK
jgi:hypothetical protein